MNSKDFSHPYQKHDLLQQRRAQQISSNMVKVGGTQMKLYHANSDLFPQNKPPLVDPRTKILRERGTWDTIAPRDPDPGFSPRHVITDRELDSYRKMIKE